MIAEVLELLKTQTGVTPKDFQSLHYLPEPETTKKYAKFNIKDKNIFDIATKYHKELSEAISEIIEREVDTKIYYTPAETTKENKKETNENPNNNYDRIAKKVFEFYDFQYNVIKKRVEFKPKSSKQYKQINFDDRTFLGIYINLCRQYGYEGVTKTQLWDVINSPIFSPDRNVLADILDDLSKKWDGVDRIKTLNSCVSIENDWLMWGDGDPTKRDTFGLKHLHIMRCVHGAYHRGFVNENLFSIQGPEHFYKTAYFRELLTRTAFKEYSNMKAPQNLQYDKDNWTRLSTVWHQLWDDFSSNSMKREYGMLKSYLSGESGAHREAYGKESEIIRLANFWGTTNTKKILQNVNEGNRRNQAVSTDKPIDLELLLSIDKDQLWGQIVSNYKTYFAKNHKLLYLTDRELEINKSNNTGYQANDELEDIITAYLRKPTEQEILEYKNGKSDSQVEWLSSIEIAEYLQSNTGNSLIDKIVWIGKKLKGLDYPNKRTEVKQGYYVIKM